MMTSVMEVIKTDSDIVKDFFFKERSRFKTRFAHDRSLERAARLALYDESSVRFANGV